jgi:hypothetical protein
MQLIEYFVISRYYKLLKHVLIALMLKFFEFGSCILQNRLLKHIDRHLRNSFILKPGVRNVDHKALGPLTRLVSQWVISLILEPRDNIKISNICT